MENTLSELSNDAENELDQKLLTGYFFPGRYSMRNISRPDNATRQKNVFSKLLLKGCQLIYMMKLDFNIQCLIYVMLKGVQLILRENCENYKPL